MKRSRSKSPLKSPRDAASAAEGPPRVTRSRSRELEFSSPIPGDGRKSARVKEEPIQTQTARSPRTPPMRSNSGDRSAHVSPKTKTRNQASAKRQAAAGGIKRARDYYEMLALPRVAHDDDIRKMYPVLALAYGCPHAWPHRWPHTCSVQSPYTYARARAHYARTHACACRTHVRA